MDKSVPYIVYESERARHERDKRRWFIICLVLILLLFGTNAAWIAYESQFESQTITQDVWQDAENGPVYVSTMDYNTYAPDVYGWELAE